MSRSFRGRPDPGKDKQAGHVPDSAPSYTEGTSAAPEGPPSQGDSSDINSRRGENEAAGSVTTQVDVGKRLVAGLIDVMVGYLLELAVNCIPIINVYAHDHVVLVAFLMVRDALFGGRGIGKNLMGLQVVDIKTQLPASMLQSLKRNVVVFGPSLLLFLANTALMANAAFKIIPNEMVSSVVTTVVSGASTVYLLAVIPYESWRVYSRADGLRWGDKVAGTVTVAADMDFSNPLSR